MAEMAAVQRIPRSLLAIIERMEREETKKIAKKTYEVFNRGSRAYGARHRNEWCSNPAPVICTGLWV